MSEPTPNTRGRGNGRRGGAPKQPSRPPRTQESNQTGLNPSDKSKKSKRGGLNASAKTASTSSPPPVTSSSSSSTSSTSSTDSKPISPAGTPKKSLSSQPTSNNCKTTFKLIEGGLDGFQNFSSFTCRKFVAGLRSWDDQKGLLFRLDPSGSRTALIKGLIKEVISHENTAEFLNDVVCSFFIWLSSAELEKGTCCPIRNKLITHAAETAGLFEFITSKWSSVTHTANQQATAWFVETVVRLDPKKWRGDSRIKDLATTLSSSANKIVSSAAARIIAILDGAQDPLQSRPRSATEYTLSMEDYKAITPGGRHDNDKTDYREIDIVPTPDEVSCQQLPFLPTPNDKWPMLDRLFRLMREDMVATLKEKLKLLAPKPGSQSKRLRGYSPAKLEGITFDKFNTWSFKISFALPENHPTATMKKSKEKEEYWELGRGKKSLTRNTLVMIAHAESPDKPLLIGEIVTRNAADLASESPSIGVRFANLEALKRAISIAKSPPDGALILVSVNIALFMYSPVLSRLKSMPLVPFLEELDDQVPQLRQSPEFAAIVAPILQQLESGYPPTVPGLEGTLDPGQLEGAKMALRQRVTLIQGPPGTGKTYIGTYIAQLLTRAPQNLRILCVTYTNHAVDDFCEGLLKCGITRLVRLGSRSASDQVANYTLAQWKARSVDKGKNMIFNRRFRNVMENIDDTRTTALRKISNAMGKQGSLKGRWRDVASHLDEQGNEWFEELSLRQVPDNSDDATDSDGFKQVGQKGEKITEDYLWRKWLDGVEAPKIEPVRRLHGVRSCWSYDKVARLKMAQQWIDEIDNELVDALSQSLMAVDEAVSDKVSLGKESDFSVLENMQVVLCTTTAAAKNSDLIKAAQCDVVLVEEAGEILETHVLSSIYEHAKALIMIGDHLQLRPKVENYALRVESGRGYNLNVSLFERLVHSGYPCATLTTQHRMHPDISRLIRPTYPLLLDSPAVSQRQPVKGFEPGLRIAFVNHNYMEGANDESADDQSVSYTNEHEADMVVKIVQYFQRQGYANDQLVVLTPYLGQLRIIMTKLKDSTISGRDAKDLLQLDPDAESIVDKGKQKGPAKAPTHSSKNVRVSSIDNYQGEESDIVIISLVRNNKLGKMGFVGDANRVNVLFSRARCGMVVLGCASFLTGVRDGAARSRWQQLIDMFQEKGQLFDYFPAYCPEHDRQLKIEKPSDFTRMSPSGGCDIICGFLLPCGHKCPLKCHPQKTSHAGVPCRAMLQWTCPSESSHAESYKCGSDPPKVCWQCQRIEAARQEFERKQEEERAKRAQAQAELEAQVAEARRQLEEEQRRHQDELQKIETQREIQRLQIEQERQRELTKALTIQAAEERNQRLEEIRHQANLKLAEQDGIVNDKREQLEREVALMREKESDAALIAGAASAAASKDFDAFSYKIDSWSGDMQLKVANVLAGQVGPSAPDLFSTERFKLKVDPAPVANLINLMSNGEFIQARKIVKPVLDKMSDNPADKPKKDFFLLTMFLCDLNISSPKASELEKMISEMIVSELTLPSSDSEEQQFLNPAAAFYPFVRAKLLDEFLTQAPSASDSKKKGAEVATLVSTFLRLPDAVHQSLFPQKYWIETSKALFQKHSAALADIMSNGDSKSTTSSAGSKAKRVHPDEELKREWMQVKRNYKLTSQAMDTLMDIAALRNLKRQLLQIIHRVQVEKIRGSSIKEVGYNLRFEGNPGTGKTTVAKLYADLLADLGVIKGDAVAKQEYEQKQQKQQQEAQEKQRQQQLQQQHMFQQANERFGGMLPPSLFAPPSNPQAPQQQNNADPPKSFVETSGAELVDEGVTKLKDQLKQIQEAGGGVLFLDEAYMLEPKQPGNGKQVLNYLLAEMEKRRGSLIVVFAGYKKKLDELFMYNEGLPSRFSATVDFEDYDDEQLYDIFGGIMRRKKTNQPLRFEDDNDHWCRVAIRRLGAGRNSPGFGNGRSVRQLFDLVSNRQAERLAKNPAADPFTFVKQDFLGPSPAEAAKTSKAWKELKSMIGLERVKKSVEALYEVVKTNEILEHEMRPRQDVALNRLFLGNPGTGKTTVAKIYGQILRDFGLLSKGEIVLKAASDFVGSVLGESQKNALAILKQAEGCVLVIDEAYGLHGKDPYKQAVIDTIVEQVQAVPGEDKCVVMLGYREQMETMLRESNPGLQRRFQLENAFQFDDYSDSELLQILKLKMAKMDLEADADALTAAVDALAVLRDTKPPFGNGGAVANMLSEAISRKAARGAGTSRKLIATDFAPPDDSAADLDEAVLFKGLIGCDEIIKQLKEYKATVQFAKSRGQDPLKKLSLSFRFVGAPGTGKTTVAARMGRMFRALGVLPSSEVIMASGTDLVGSYVGQTAPKTRELMDKGLGKVLFIDEAYSLAGNSGSFGQEAVDELVRCLTADKYMNKMVVIVAGYENDIDRLMQINDGLRSRFEQVVRFRPFNLEESCRLLKLRLASPEVDLKLAADLESSGVLAAQMSRISDHPRFSNGRDVIAWCKKIERAISMRATSSLSDNAPEVTADILVSTMNEMIASMSTSAKPDAPVGSGDKPKVQAQTQTPEPPKEPVITLKEDIAVAEPDPKKPAQAATPDDGNNDDYFGMKISTELMPLNDVLEGQMKLSGGDIDKLAATENEQSTQMKEALERLAKMVGDRAVAISIIKKWQAAKKKAEEERQEAEEAIRAAFLERLAKLKPIVQCQVCKSTANYWTPCPVAPKIIGYENA